MRPNRTPVLACVLATAVVLGPLLITEPAVAHPSATCVEPHAAKVVRSALRTTLAQEASTYAEATGFAKTQLARAQATQTTVLADTASTSSARGIAAAEVAYPNRRFELIAAATVGLARDRAKITRCGLPAMRRLSTRANERERDYVIDSLVAFRTTGHAYLKWDRISRDGAAAGSAEYTTFAKHVTADELIIQGINQTIRSIRTKPFPTSH